MIEDSENSEDKNNINENLSFNITNEEKEELNEVSSNDEFIKGNNNLQIDKTFLDNYMSELFKNDKNYRVLIKDICHFCVDELSYTINKLTNEISHLASVIDKVDKERKIETENIVKLCINDLYERLLGKKSQKELNDIKEKDKEELSHYVSQPDNFLNDEIVSKNYIESEEKTQTGINNKELIETITNNLVKNKKEDTQKKKKMKF